MDIDSRKKSFKFHLISARSPQSTNTNITGKSKQQFVALLFLSFNNCDMKRYILNEENEYIKSKQIIESGYLSQRSMSKFLKPNRLKWQKKNLKIHDTIQTTRLNIADIILNVKEGQSHRELLIEKIQNQIESSQQIICQNTIKSEHTIQTFMDRMKFQSKPKKSKDNLHLLQNQFNLKILSSILKQLIKQNDQIFIICNEQQSLNKSLINLFLLNMASILSQFNTSIQFQNDIYIYIINKNYNNNIGIFDQSIAKIL